MNQCEPRQYDVLPRGGGRYSPARSGPKPARIGLLKLLKGVKRAYEQQDQAWIRGSDPQSPLESPGSSRKETCCRARGVMISTWSIGLGILEADMCRLWAARRYQGGLRGTWRTPRGYPGQRQHVLACAEPVRPGTSCLIWSAYGVWYPGVWRWRSRTCLCCAG